MPMAKVGLNPVDPNGSAMCPTILTKVRTLWNSAALSAVTVPADILSTPTYLEFIQSINSDFGEGLRQIDPKRHVSHWTPSTKNTPSNASQPTSPAILLELNKLVTGAPARPAAQKVRSQRHSGNRGWPTSVAWARRVRGRDSEAQSRTRAAWRSGERCQR